ncbi:MAG: ATP-binding cassette domain-containing protein [Bacteroidales bacterium]|nr:ATP-binding cassette domain-containing protein [Bacteroidales bacterium]
MDRLYEIENLRCSYDKNYREGVSKVVLEIRKLALPKGKKIFIVGESGIGKSTILEVLGLMNNTIVSGEDSRYLFYEDGEKVDLLKLWADGSDDKLSSFRLKHFNFIFQSTNLMRNFTAYENVALTRMLQGYSREEAFAKAAVTLKELGLEHIDENRMTQELSGGQQQRLAFARAILPDFTVLFGDEPTGNLDSDNAVRAMELLTAKLNELHDSSAVIVSHDMPLAVSFADVIIKIRKEESEIKHAQDETAYKGVIDNECVFLPSEDRSEWSNGTQSYTTEDFKLFLKKI